MDEAGNLADPTNQRRLEPGQLHQSTAYAPILKFPVRKAPYLLSKRTSFFLMFLANNVLQVHDTGIDTIYYKYSYINHKKSGRKLLHYEVV